MSDNQKGPMETYYDDMVEYLKAKFPDAGDVDIKETAAFATNRSNITLSDMLLKRDDFWNTHYKNFFKIAADKNKRILDILNSH